MNKLNFENLIKNYLNKPEILHFLKTWKISNFVKKDKKLGILANFTWKTTKFTLDKKKKTYTHKKKVFKVLFTIKHICSGITVFLGKFKILYTVLTFKTKYKKSLHI